MRLFSGFLIVIMIFFLAACGREEEVIPTEFTTELTDQLAMDFNYEMNAFLSTGVGQVILVSCEDGDTAEFLTEDTVIRVRFIGIDTPEASGVYEPWGYQATQFTCERLDNAEVIVLEYDEAAGTETYGRELAYVWYDGRLLNLELVEQGYATIFGIVNHKYATEFIEADRRARLVGGRIHETENTDPLWDYSSEPREVTIRDLVESPEDYAFAFITVEGVINRTFGNHAYLEQDGYGVFVFMGHSSSANIEEGNHLRLNGVRFVNDLVRRNGWHITGFTQREIRAMELVAENVVVEPQVVELENVDETLFGKLTRINNLTVQSIDIINDGYTEILVKDQDDETFVLRQESLVVDYSRDFDFSTITVGDTIDVIGIIVNSVDGPFLRILDADDVITE